MEETTFYTPWCVMCGEREVLTYGTDRIERWREGALIQTVFPELSPSERELMISGTHADCWGKLNDE